MDCHVATLLAMTSLQRAKERDDNVIARPKECDDNVIARPHERDDNVIAKGEGT